MKDARISGDTERTTGQPVPLDRLLKDDFPRERRSVRRNRAGDGAQAELPSWKRASKVIHLDPETYRPQEVIPDEVLTRMNADRGRPHPIPNRPPPEPDFDDFFFDETDPWDIVEDVRECENCGEPFVANAPNHRYCSVKCAYEGRSSLRTCPVCGEEFTTERPRQRYCSLACVGKAKRNPDNDRLCRECGGRFRATRKEQVFCSRECSRIWRKWEQELR